MAARSYLGEFNERGNVRNLREDRKETDFRIEGDGSLVAVNSTGGQRLSGYLDPGERLDDPDEVLLQQVVVQFGQVGADDGVIPQLRLVVCEGLEVPDRRGTLTTRPSAKQKTQRLRRHADTNLFEVGQRAVLAGQRDAFQRVCLQRGIQEEGETQTLSH